MPTITLNKKVLEKTIGKKFTDKELKEKIPMLGTDLEGIEGNEINVEIFPNRPDLLSDQGFARAFSTFVGQTKGLKKYEVKKPLANYEVIVDKSVNEARPYTACAIVKNLNLNEEKIEEIIKIQEKLHITYGRNRKKMAIGIYPLEKIKLPIKYLAKKPNEIKFIPLGYTYEMNGNQILEEHEKGKEFAHLLKGKKEYPIFMDSNNEILSMPPVINSEKTGKIDENTNEVFIECSGFDFEYLKTGLNMIVTALADMGGEIYSMTLKYQDKKIVTPNLEPQKMKIEIEYVNKKLGMKFTEKDIKNLLEKMGYGYEKGYALIPSYRADILHQIDLVEDIAIAYGYNNFKPTMTDSSTIGKENDFSVFKNKVREILTGLGFLETNTYNLTSKEKQTTMMNSQLPVVELINSLSEEYNVLRYWTTPSLLDVLQNNRNKEYPQKIFTIGRNFKYGESETGIVETERLALCLAGKGADYTKARQVLDYLFKMIGIKGTYKETQHPTFIPGRVARAYVENKAVAYIGEIHPEIINKWNLRVPISAFELNLMDLFEITKK